MLTGRPRRRGITAASVLALLCLPVAALVAPASAASVTSPAATRHPRYTATTVPAPAATWITNAHWVDPPTSPSSSSAATPLPVFAKQVTLPSTPVSAILSIAGEGVTVADVNGRPIGAGVLEPGYSADTARVDYTGYDVTSLLTAGDNRITVALGTGIYAEAGAPDRYLKLPHVSGPIGFIAELTLTYADGSTTSIGTDPTWATTLGNTTYAGWYGGEDVDLRRLPPDWELPTTPLVSWDSAVVLTSAVPTTLTLTRRIGPPVVVVDTTTAVSVVQVTPTRWIADFGTNLAGWPQVSVGATPGTRLVLTPAELIAPDAASVDQRTLGVTTNPVFDSVVLTGVGTETWHPQFVYHGFRYLQIDVTDGALSAPLTAAALTRMQLRTAVNRVGDFTSSDGTLNAVHDLVDRAMQSNMFSVLTDCPNREKLGWLEQDGIVFDSLADSYDLSAYGRRFVQHMADAQRADGGVPDIAPENVALPPAFREDPNWGGSLVVVPWRLFQNYGDVGTMTEYYPAMVRYVDHLNGQAAQSGLLTSGLGDWLTLDSRTPRGLVVALGYHRVLTTMTSVAHALGKSADEARDAAFAAQVAQQINDRWLRSTGDYGPDQASNALALEAGIVPAWAVGSTQSALVGSIAAAGGHLKVGEIGLPAVLHQLSVLGRDDIAYRAVVASDAPGGFGYIVASGATALTEEWAGQHSALSQNHLVLGTVDDWMTTRLAGIRQAPGSVGFASLVVSPSFVPGLTSASATRTTPLGTIAVSWQRTSTGASVDVTLPAGVSASVQLPSGTTTIGEGHHVLTTAVPGWPASATLPASPWRGAGPVLQNAQGRYRLDARTGRPLRLTPEEYVGLGRPAVVKVPSVVVRFPWSTSRWLLTRWQPARTTWTAVPLDVTAWRALGSPTPRVEVLPGMYVGSAAPSPDIWARTPDGSAHRLTYSEYRALGNPSPVPLGLRWTRYPGAPDIWAVQTWPGSRTSAHRVTAAEWASFGRPRPGARPLAPGSAVLRWGASRQIFLRTPDARTRSITAADYVGLGRPAVTWQPGTAFVQVPGSPKILLITDTSSGAGSLLTPTVWASFGRPVPEWRPVPHLRWTTGADGIAIELTGGARISMTTAEWVAAGSPALVPV